MSSNCACRNTAMDESQFFQSGNLSPALKIRRRTSSDATWRARRRQVDNEWNENVKGHVDRIYNDTCHQQQKAIWRTDMTKTSCRITPPVHSRDDNDNNCQIGPRSSSPSAMMTSSSLNYSRPPETVVKEAKVIPVGEKLAAVEQTIREILEAHAITNVHTVDSVKRGLMMCEAINKTHGISICDDNNKSLRSKMTQTDPKKVWTMFTNNMAPTIKRVSAFANLLPGFASLDAEDQKMLFKQGSFEVILARFCRCFTSEGMLTPDMTMIIPRQLIHQMPLGDLFLKQYEFADIFNRLNLTDPEVGLVCSVLLINSERNGLRSRLPIQKLQVHYMQCLYVYLSKLHPDDYDEVFEKILDVMPLSAAVNESHARKVNAIKTAAANRSTTIGTEPIAFPDLHNEVFQ